MKINSPALWKKLLKIPQPEDHKYSRGHLAVICGPEMIGASILAAQAARRAGCGIVTVIAPQEAKNVFHTVLPGCVISCYQKFSAVPGLLQERTVDAFVVGQGLGEHKQFLPTIKSLLKTTLPCVLDAGALLVFREKLSIFYEHLHGKCVLTPHPGEFQKVFSSIGDRENCCKKIMSTTSATLVLKGSKTLCAQREHGILENTNAPPDLATAGSGDVLTGTVGSFLAQKMPSFWAANAAVWVHGEAGKKCGYGLIAEDLPDVYPQVLEKIM